MITVKQRIVHQEKGKWHFWYEDWASKSLPYNTEEGCDTALRKYCREVLGHEEKEERRKDNGC